jgi:hypothetical protein
MQRSLIAVRSQRVALTAGVVGILLLGAAPAPPASAAPSGCGGAGPTVNHGGERIVTRYCYAWRGYMTLDYDYKTMNGYLYPGTSWFVCQSPGAENPRDPHSGARNRWWLWTLADNAYRNGGWGWFPATFVSGGANYQPIPGLQRCP